LEVYNFCTRNNLPNVWVYLYREWYTIEKWLLWARAARPFQIPNGKSTMLVESHWRVLKCNHLYHYNRPRLDFLVYVIIKRHCKDLVDLYNQKVINRRDRFSWERQFVSQWNGFVSVEDASRQDYTTTLGNWVCGCPQFVENRFLICKHLVRNSGIGRIRVGQFFIQRRFDYPFIKMYNIRPPSIQIAPRIANIIISQQVSKKTKKHDSNIYSTVYV
jgi:hypothetical protein